MEFNPHALQMSDDEYHGDITRVSKSGLDLIHKSPAHYYYRYLDPNRNPEEDEETKALFEGKAVHCAIGEPNRFEGTYMLIGRGAPEKPSAAERNIVAKRSELLYRESDWLGHVHQYGEAPRKPQARELKIVKKSDELLADIQAWEKYETSIAGTEPPKPLTDTERGIIQDGYNLLNKVNEWDAYAQSIAGKIILTKAQYDMCSYLRDKCHKHPLLGDLLSAGHAEQTYHAVCQITGALTKIRVDWDMEDWILDFKTTINAKREEFEKSMWNYRYDVSGSLYTDTKEQATGVTPKGFIIAALEKKAPYNIGVYYLPTDIIDIGRKRHLRDLQTYVDCKAANDWPGYSESAEPIGLPPWAMKYMNENY